MAACIDTIDLESVNYVSLRSPCLPNLSPALKVYILALSLDSPSEGTLASELCRYQDTQTESQE